MKATTLLRRQHSEVSKLFKQILKTEKKPEKRTLFLELAHKLVAHDAIEREIFYPACEKKLGLVDILGESLAEHGIVEFCLYQADEALGRSDFDFHAKALKDIVEHHVEEEHEKLFPKAEKTFTPKELNELGARMEARFDEVSSKSFRLPLHQNLKQVLAGALKTGKNVSPRQSDGMRIHDGAANA